MFGFRQRALHAWPRRLQTWLLNHLSNYAPRTQRVYLASIRGARFKRLVLPDSHCAERVVANLNAFAAERIYPDVVFVKEREVWLEYVEGRRVDRVDAQLVEQMAGLLAVLNKRDPRRVPTAETSFLHALHVDLRFLHRVGVLGEAAYRDLDSAADAAAPASVWVGYDCTDTILKNFVLAGDGRLVAVDAESLGADQLIGSGAAKACLRWLGDQRETLLDRMRGLEAPDFQAYMPFVELSFLAFWTKASFLEGKRRYVDPALFERFRARA